MKKAYLILEDVSIMKTTSSPNPATLDRSEMMLKMKRNINILLSAIFCGDFEFNEILCHDYALWGYTGPLTTWVNEMTVVLLHLHLLLFKIALKWCRNEEKYQFTPVSNFSWRLWNEWDFMPRLCNVRLYWAADNLS